MLNSIPKFSDDLNIAVVIPAYRVTASIIDLLKAVPIFVSQIYVIDDCCPDSSGRLVEEVMKDCRIKVIYNEINRGVGGAVMLGYQYAIKNGATIIVKIDGDGQMDPELIPQFIAPIINGHADYTKGNRFYYLHSLTNMPAIRIFGNAILSFMTKVSSGYWNLFDPTNGYTAIHADIVARLPFDKISKRYFFETDLLCNLNLVRAVVKDVPMNAKYDNEVSNLKIRKILGEFLWKHTRNFFKRIFYNYYLRDFSLASIELPFGLGLTIFGVCYGGFHWYDSMQLGVETPAGTVMLSALPILLGVQLVLAFIGYDIRSVPTEVTHSSVFKDIE